MKYVNLVESSNDFEVFLDKIEKDCKPFLKYKRVIYRGMDTKNQDYGEQAVRKNRVSKSGRNELSAFINAYLDSKNLPNRSRSVFGIRDVSHTTQFGDSCLIFPKGNFKFVWFPKIIDLIRVGNGNLGDALRSLPKDVFTLPFDEIKKEILKVSYKFTGADDALIKLVSMLDEHKTDKFPSNTKNSPEIIIECDEYYFIKGNASVMFPMVIPSNKNMKEAINRFGLM